MKQNQKLTPKYWIAHDTTTDDVIITTAAKSLYDCQLLTYKYCGWGWLGGVGQSDFIQVDLQVKLEEEHPEIEFRLFEVAYPKSEDFGPDATLVAPKAAPAN